MFVVSIETFTLDDNKPYNHIISNLLRFVPPGIEFFTHELADLLNGRRVAVVAPNPDTVAKAQIFRHGLMDAWHDTGGRVSFAMFSRAPVVEGSKLHHEAELLGSVQGADVIIVDDIIDTANTLVRAAQVCKASGAKNVFIWASHGLFTRDALRKIEECPEITKVACTNTLPLPEWYSGKKVSSKRDMEGLCRSDR